MGMENGFGRPKTKEELEKQLKGVEEKIGETLVADNERDQVLTLSLEELKTRFPEQYERYFAELKIAGEPLRIQEQTKIQQYSGEELALARQGLSGTVRVPKELLEKIESDENIKAYTPLALFPEIQERIYGKNEKPEIQRLRTQTRGRAFKIGFSDATYVVKQTENSFEPVIATIAANLGVSPKQYESIQGYITEEFIQGVPIAKLGKEQATPEVMEDLGKKIGAALKKLHERNIIVNDQLIRDDFGRSHALITPENEIRFIDLGAAVDVSTFPDLSDEVVYALARTDSSLEVQMMIHGSLDQNQEIAQKKLEEFLGHYKERLLKFKNAEELVKARDYELINQGIYFLSHELPNTNAFSRGIQAGLIEKK